MTKLSWTFDTDLNCEVAYLRGYRIRAERDNDATNPFEDWDGNWPIAIYYDGSIKSYERTKGVPIRDVLSRFTPGHIIHDQIAIAKALGFSDTREIMECYSTLEAVRYCRDAEELRRVFEQAISDMSDSALLDAYEALYNLLGLPCYKTTSTGYCQGDWAEVLVVATPDAQAEFGSTEVTEADLEATADLYGYWAWGDVYGYVIEKPVFDADGEIEGWVDACDHNSCWGYYGDDHDKSGLEEAALECVPDEPVTSRDDLVEECV